MTETKKLLTIATTCFVVALFCVGCSMNKLGPKETKYHSAYAPNSVEINPLSRFRNSSDPDKERMIIVHVEFRDGDDFACRGIGLLHITLTDLDGNSLVTETISLDNPSVNRQHFDSVTRTYRVHFNKVPENLTQATVRATFAQEDENPIRSKSYTIQSNE